MEHIMRIESGGALFPVDARDRDWKVLSGPYFKAGEHFQAVLGMWEHMSVAHGFDYDAVDTVPYGKFSATVRTLGFAIAQDQDLLEYNYAYSFESEGKRRNSGGQSGFRVRGYYGDIDVHPPGFCHLTLTEVAPNGIGRMVEFHDMRIQREMQTDELGRLRIYRRKAELRWPQVIAGLTQFLESHRDSEVKIHYK